MMPGGYVETSGPVGAPGARFSRDPDGFRLLLVGWILPFLSVLYVWQQSHFQFEQYWPDHLRSAIRLAMEASVMVMFVLGCRRLCDRRLLGFVVLLVFTALFYAILELLVFGVLQLAMVKGAILAVALIPVVDSCASFRRFLATNYWLGILAIGLSTVPLVHFLGWVDLPFEQVRRVGGDLGRPDLDPLSFGLFGRTESYAQPGSGLPRLQGWASEPLHWSYFVFWTLACWMLTFPGRGRPLRRGAHWLGLVLILGHLWLLQSSTARVVGAGCLAAIAAAWWLGKSGYLQAAGPWIFAGAVIGPGLGIPFAIAGVEGMEHLILSESVLSEGSNWRGKVEFLQLGTELFGRFAPFADGRSSISVSHNLVLDTYLRFGYLLLVPLLVQFYIVLDAAARTSSVMVVGAALVVVFDHTLATPGVTFAPSGTVFLLAMFAATLRADGKSAEPLPVLATGGAMAPHRGRSSERFDEKTV